MPDIKHLAVLMMENRSFDHMLGFVRSEDYPIDGLAGNEANRDEDGEPSKVNDGARYSGDLRVDPGHSFGHVKLQIYGTNAVQPGQQPDMSGFVKSYQRVTGSPAKAKRIMNCFKPDKLPILTTLARQFAVCDRWFCAVPGPTFPNRIYAHAGTSLGRLDMSPDFLRRYRTIYEVLREQRVSSTIYYHDQTLTMSLPSLVQNQAQFFGNINQFVQDCRNDQLPAYCFIEPRYNRQDIDGDYFPANDQHPDHDVAEGEKLIKQVYLALRSNPRVWESSLLVILYDQHGGIYDHVPPPICVAPDNLACEQPAFDFTRLGVRVPAVLVSPYIEAGTISRAQYDHTSLLATAMKLFTSAWPSQTLGQRAAAANTFDAVCTRSTARTDVPDFVRRAAGAGRARAAGGPS